MLYTIEVIINPIKTHLIVPFTESIFSVLDTHVKKFEEKSILVITSKIISICEGSVIQKNTSSKSELAKVYGDRYVSVSSGGKTRVFAQIHGVVAINAGIDASNSKDYFVLPPVQPQKTADEICQYLLGRFTIKHVGVVITDSVSWPLRRGTMGVAFAHSGFLGIKKYVGKPDLVGRIHTSTFSNIRDSLAASAVVTMGEGSERTPLAVITDVPFVVFQNRKPTPRELAQFAIETKDDFFSFMLKPFDWKKPKKNP